MLFLHAQLLWDRFAPVLKPDDQTGAWQYLINRTVRLPGNSKGRNVWLQRRALDIAYKRH